MRRRFPGLWIEGETSRQAHCDLPPGTFERELGREGFYGAASHLYHRHPPTAWSAVDGPLRPRAFDCALLDASAGGPWQAAPLLANGHCRIRFWRTAQAMTQLVRNADGDELLFVHTGSGELFCDYGHLHYRDGDYLLLPRGTQWRLAPAAATELLLIEASGEGLGLPERGLLGEHALFDPALLDTPHLDAEFLAQQGEEPWQVVVKRGGQLTTISYPFNPLDAVGWKGELTVLRLNWRDIRPVGSHRYHLPPSVHSTFAAERFVVCTFVPRPLERDPGALKVPFFHSNDDYDEVIFYHRGAFFSRDDIRPGMLTLHPAGITHGPQPAALRAGLAAQRSETDEVAVMIDLRDAVVVDPAAAVAENSGYVASWGGMGATP